MDMLRFFKKVDILDTYEQSLKNNTIEEINLVDENIGENGAKKLAKMIACNRSLKVLRLENNVLGDKGTNSLVSVLALHSSLEELYLQNNQISNIELAALPLLIGQSKTLTNLNLADNNIDDNSVNALIPSLASNISLSKLSLCGNKVADNGAKALSELLLKHDNLVSLSLQNNYISVEGAQAIAAAIKTNTKLQALYLGNNKIGADKGAALIAALEHNVTLNMLDIYDNKIGAEGEFKIEVLLERNRKLLQQQLSEKNQNKKEYIKKMNSAKENANELINSQSNNLSVEKSWYFDEKTKSDNTNQIQNYSLIPASQKDVQKVIHYYQHHPVPGYDIQSVKVIYNPTMNRSFALNMALLQERFNNKAFNPKWSQESKNVEECNWRSEINELLEKMAAPYTDNDYPAVKLLPLWHGTKLSVLESLFKTGYANLASTDSGFFGKGIYSAHEAEYSYRVYSEGALIVNWVGIFSAYPVIKGDMAKLKEKGNYQNYDAHFIPVVSADPNNPKTAIYYPCAPKQKHQYTEVVVFEKSQCLPRYLVELQPSLPASPSLSPLIQTQPNTLLSKHNVDFKDENNNNADKVSIDSFEQNNINNYSM